MSGGLGQKVCVVGAGMLGLAAIKNLVEEGFEVTCIERNDYVGGLWHTTTDTTQVSVLEGTRAIINKFAMPYTDFPFPEKTSVYPTARELQDYLDAYADHFDLRQCIKFNATVVRLYRDEDKQQWSVHVRSGDSPVEVHSFDRVVVANGIHTKWIWPELKGRELFEGETIHGLAFKEPAKYKGKTVLVLGIGATGADASRFLAAAGAKKVYIAHRSQIVLFPRMFQGKAGGVSHRAVSTMSMVAQYAPAYANNMKIKAWRSLQDKAFPELASTPAFDTTTRRTQDPAATIPIISEDFARCLIDGSVQSVQSIERVIGPRSVQLTDGTVLKDIDTLICSTGASMDLSSLLPPDCDPSNPDLIPDHLPALPEVYRRQRPVLRLYRGWLSPHHPHSLAILGYALRLKSSAALADQVTMAMAQLWKGTYPMPSRAEMELDVDAQHHRAVAVLKNGDISFPGLLIASDFDSWHGKVSGTGVHEHLGNWLSYESWKLWWYDREFYNLLMDGFNSPHIERLFETRRGRKSWKGAREAIVRVNAEKKRVEEDWKKRKAEGGGDFEY